MNTLRLFSIAAALGLASAAYAQTETQTQGQTTPPTSQQPPTESSDPSAASSPHQQETTRGTTTGETSPAPPTGTTGTSSADPSAASSPHQKQATGEEEDDTRMSSANAGTGASAGDEPQVMGLEVITPAGDPLGAVVDVVMDSSGAPSYAVITSAGKATPVPYSTVASMVHDNAVVMDQSKLQGAPKVEKGAWRDSSSTEWQSEADRYWGKSSMRTASPETSDSDSSKKKDRY